MGNYHGSFGLHDIGEEQLEYVLESSEHKKLLSELVDLSRNVFGFFNKTAARSFEYPYIINEIGTIAGKKVLDIGAGLSPLPLFLAKSGASVVTVDNSPVTRKIGQPHTDWNGWGYLDYGELNNSLISYNKDIAFVRLAANSFDCIYSVSVIEHLPAATRRSIWPVLSEALIDNGTLLLTIDLVPGTNILWNYCQGDIVDSFDNHGDVETIKQETSLCSLELKECRFLRNLAGSPVDIALLKISK